MHGSCFERNCVSSTLGRTALLVLSVVTLLAFCSKSGLSQRKSFAINPASFARLTFPPGPAGPNSWEWGARQLPKPFASQQSASGSGPRPFASADSDRDGSTNVSIDSLVYPALERLAEIGLIPSQSVSIRPWTRQECRRQVREAGDILSGFASMDRDVDRSARDEAARLLPGLMYELQEPDGKAAVVLESVYGRVGTIVGPALTDGFHFGQTWRNDFGRPLGRGSSAIVGFSVRATSGRFFFYDRQELQTDPGLPAVTSARADLFNQIDNAPFFIPDAPTIPPGALILPASAIPAYVRQRPIELYAGVAFGGNNLSFGKQELYWGPTTMGPLSFSSNAEPTYNLRLVATRPHPIPFLSSLGSYRFDFVFGKLSGHHRPARPYYNGQKFALLLGPYLEMSVTRWAVLWGVDHPMTLGNLQSNLFSTISTGSTFAYGDRSDPGDRKSGFDFRLHVPGLSRYLTLYADSYADDEPNPLDAPRRVMWHPGMYVARLPFFTHADFRFEVASSQELAKDENGSRVFINNQYRDANTNKGFLLGNAVGRDARAMEGRIGYWFSARSRIEGGFRQTKGSHVFLPGGSTISDAFATGNFALKKDWTAQVFGQYERFLMPSYMAGSQSNGSVRLQITWTPKDVARTR